MADKAFITYLPDNNTVGAYLAGVPLADLDQATFEALPRHARNSVRQCGFYEVDASAAAIEFDPVDVNEQIERGLPMNEEHPTAKRRSARSGANKD